MISIALAPLKIGWIDGWMLNWLWWGSLTRGLNIVMGDSSRVWGESLYQVT